MNDGYTNMSDCSSTNRLKTSDGLCNKPDKMYESLTTAKQHGLILPCDVKVDRLPCSVVKAKSVSVYDFESRAKTVSSQKIRTEMNTNNLNSVHNSTSTLNRNTPVTPDSSRSICDSRFDFYGPEERYMCSRCYMMYRSKRLLDRHIRNAHSLCGTDNSASERSTLVAVEVLNSETSHCIDNFQQFECKKEPIEWETGEFYETQQNDEQFKCKQEPIESETKKENEPVVKTLATCEFCSANFDTNLALLRHKIAIHPETVDKKHMCEHCGRTFVDKGSLPRHSKKCKFTQSKDVIRNRKRRGPQTFECSFCYKLFSLKSRFEQHVSLHTGEILHQCHICKTTYTRAETLRRHLRRHNSDWQLTCNDCGKGFRDRYEFKNHFKRCGKPPGGQRKNILP